MAQDVGFKKTAANETQYSTGASRDNRVGKGAFHWMPWDAVWLVSNIYEKGNIGRSKTGDGHDRNWEHGMPILDYLQSAMNHITAHIAGDRSEAHISQAIWNLLNYLQVSIWITLGFRPKELNKLPDHRHAWKPGDEPANPLSPQEIEWLKFKGVLPKDEETKLKLTYYGQHDTDPTPAEEDKIVVVQPKSVTVTPFSVVATPHHDPDPGDVHDATRP
jgi:Domain of unknown function (DUF5664)